MRFFPVWLCAMFLGFSGPAVSGPEDGRSGAPEEVVPRDGLPRFFARLEAGEPVRVAYLGGSITAQNGWRVQTLDWLRGQYPDVRIGEINAAIGGTGSDLGVFRLQGDVLDKRPDLLFVEFVVNDGGAPPDRIRRTMEGIVRKTWRVLPDCDIAFVYTLTGKDVPTLSAGLRKPPAAAMEEVAAHYGIPSIDLGVSIAALHGRGRLVMASDDTPAVRPSGTELDETSGLPTDAEGRIIFSKDGVHPYPDTGHVLYTQAIIRAIPAIKAASSGGADRRAGPLKPPLMADNWENATLVPLGARPADNGIRIGGAGAASPLDPREDARARDFSASFPALWKLGPGATLGFRFRGTHAAFYDLLGPDGGALRVEIDGRRTSEPRRFDGYGTYWRLGRLSLGENLPDTVHSVEVTVLPAGLDKREILFERNRADFDKDPQKYEGSHWHVGALLLLGEIEKED